MFVENRTSCFDCILKFESETIDCASKKNWVDWKFLWNMNRISNTKTVEAKFELIRKNFWNVIDFESNFETDSIWKNFCDEFDLNTFVFLFFSIERRKYTDIWTNWFFNICRFLFLLNENSNDRSWRWAEKNRSIDSKNSLMIDNDFLKCVCFSVTTNFYSLSRL